MKETEKYLEKVILNKHGYYELREKPDKQELASFYSDKYFQENKKPHLNVYSEKELEMINNKIEQKFLIIKDILNKKEIYKSKFRLLDIGCGEGWALNYFFSKNWNVVGLDYSSFGCHSFNPGCMEYLIAGDIYENIESLILQGEKFDVIWMTNVLEHVIDPEALLVKSKMLVNDGGIMIVQVPNDFSELQIYLLENDYIEEPFWIISPDHISYFSRNSLIKLMSQTGWKKEKIQADFPIDWNLFNENTNYIKDKSKGRNVHLARVEIENFLHRTDPGKTNDLYELLGEMNIGRQIIGYFSK